MSNNITVTMSHNSAIERNRDAAAVFVCAIKTIAAKPENLDNLQCYLTQHFAVWLDRWANTPEALAAEMRGFANMEL